MNHRIAPLTLTFACALALVACDQSSSNTPATTVQTHTEAAHDHADHAHEHAEAAHQEVEKAGEQIKESAAAAVEQSADAQSNAQKLLEQAIAYINENKLDLADKTLTQLEGMGLPDSFASQIADARKLLDAKKSADSVQGAAEGLKGMLKQ